jgi:hypothetical protein
MLIKKAEKNVNSQFFLSPSRLKLKELIKATAIIITINSMWK